MIVHLLLSLLHVSNSQMFGWPQGVPVQQMIGRPPTPIPLPIPMKSMQSMYPMNVGTMTQNRAGGSSPFSFNGIISNIKNFFSSHPSGGQQMPQIPPQLLSNPQFRQQLEQVLLSNPALAQSVIQSLGQQNAAMLQLGNQVQSRLAVPNQQQMTNIMAQTQMSQPMPQPNPQSNPQSRVFNNGVNQQRAGDDLFLLTAPFKISDDTVSTLVNVANQENDTKQRAMLMKQLLDQANANTHQNDPKNPSPTNNIVVHKVVPAEDPIETSAKWASAATDNIHTQALPNIMKAISQLPDNPDRGQLLSILKDHGLLAEAQSALSSLRTSSPPTSIQAILKANDEAKLRSTSKRPPPAASGNTAIAIKTSAQNQPLKKIPKDLAERLRGLGMNPDFLPDLIRSANLVTNSVSSNSENPAASGSSSVLISQNTVSQSLKKAKDDNNMQELRTQLQSLPQDELTKVQNLIQIVVGKPHYLPRLLKEDLPPNIRKVLLTVQRLKFPETMTTTPMPSPVHIPTTTEPATTATVTNQLDQATNDAINALTQSITVQSQTSKVSTQAATRSPLDQDNLKEESSMSFLKSESSSSDKYIPLLYWLTQNEKESKGNFASSTSSPVSFNRQKLSQVQNQVASSSNQQPTVSDFNPRTVSMSSTQAPVQSRPVVQSTPKPNNFASLPFIKNLPIEILGSFANNMPAQKPGVDVVHAGTSSGMQPDVLSSTPNSLYGLRTSPKPTIQFETTVPTLKFPQSPQQKDDQPTIPLAALAAALEPKALSSFLQSIQKKQEPKDGRNLFKIELSQESLPTSVPLSAIFNSASLNSSNLMSFLSRFASMPALSRMLPSSTTSAPITAPPPTYVSLLFPSSTAAPMAFFPFMQEHKNLEPSTLSPKPSSSSVRPPSEDRDSSDEDRHSHNKKFGHGKKPLKHQSALSSSEERESDGSEKHSKHYRKESKDSYSHKDGKHVKHRPSGTASNEKDENGEKDREAAHSETHTKWATKHHHSTPSSSEERSEHSEHSKHQESHSQKEAPSSEDQRDDSREMQASHHKSSKYGHKSATWHEKYRPSLSSSSEDGKEYKGKHSQKSSDWPVKSRSFEDDDDEETDRKSSWKHKKDNMYSKEYKSSSQATKPSKTSSVEDKKSDRLLGYHQKEDKTPSSDEDSENEKADVRRQNEDTAGSTHSSTNKGNTDSYHLKASPSDGQRVEINIPSNAEEPDRLRDEQGLNKITHAETSEGHPNTLNGDQLSEKDLQTQFADSPSLNQGWEPVNPFRNQLVSKSLMKENETNTYLNRERGTDRSEAERYAWENSQRAVVLPEQIQPIGPNQGSPATSSRESKQYDFDNWRGNQREHSSSEQSASRTRDPNQDGNQDFRASTDSQAKHNWAVTPDYILSPTTPNPRPNYDRPSESQEDRLEGNPTHLQNQFSQQMPPSSHTRLKDGDESAEANTRHEVLHGRERPCTHKPSTDPGSTKVKVGDNMSGSQIYQVTSPYGKDKLIKLNSPLQKDRSYKPTGKLDKLDGKFLPQTHLLSSTLTFPNSDPSRSKYKNPSTFKNSFWGFQGMTDTSFNNYESSTQSPLSSTASGQSETNSFLPIYPETTTPQNNDSKLSSLNNVTVVPNSTASVAGSSASLIPMASENQGSVDKTSQWPFWTTQATSDSVTGTGSPDSINMFYYNSNFSQPASVFNLPITDNPEDALPNDAGSTLLVDNKSDKSNTSDNSAVYRPFYGTNTLWPTFSSHNSGGGILPQIYDRNTTRYSPQDKVVTNHTDVQLNSSTPDSSIDDDPQITNSTFIEDNAASATDVKHVEMSPPHFDVFTRINNPHKSNPNTNSTASVFIPPVRKINLRPSGRNVRPKQDTETTTPSDNDGDHMFSFGNWPKSGRTSEEATTTATTTTVGPRKIKLRWSGDKLGHRKVLNSKPVNFYNYYQPNSETE